MNDFKHYTPILATKQGELNAIKALSKEALKRITPFFDIHRLFIQKEKKQKTLKEHIDKILNNLKKSWPKDQLFFIDCTNFNLEHRLDDGIHPLKYICEQLLMHGMQFVPTIGTDRDLCYIEEMKAFLDNYPKQNLCFRLLKEDFINPAETKEEVNIILSKLGITSKSCHLIIDFGYVAENDIDVLIEDLSQFNLYMPFNNWLTFTIASGSFPADMSGIPVNSIKTIPRVEFSLWKAVLMAYPLIGREPRFGDYSINNPNKIEIDPAKVRGSGKIRQTVEKEWLIFKGHGLHKGEKYQQYRSLSKQIVESPHYKGREYSWGDNHLFKCANNITEGPGNLTTWIAVDTNHHLTLVGEQIANFDETLETD
ncbi:beta family protein [Candidatus Berkiella cookevillensis]|uniref:Beta family protein n=1 Tax=Candidatus Berkiella cookevillensis TaxID=437022 RepID=A0A0Q9YIA6_9GAMM|nr:beta family protein [Candidatus Berkiella cookevillensis]MCS5707787.1 beta family protein [Candidatus Berkiella cookevillensis]